MRYVLFLLLLLTVMSTDAQPRYVQTRDDDTKELVYVGELVFYDLEKEPEFKWFSRTADAYEPDTAAISYLRQHLKGYEIITFIGTWCSDSKDMIPKLYKVLRMADYPMKWHTMYALDMSKKGQYKEEEKYNIENVPTIILYKDGEEAGRIVETVDESVEADLQAIIQDFE